MDYVEVWKNTFEEAFVMRRCDLKAIYFICTIYNSDVP